MEVLKKHKADQDAQKREMGDLWNEGKFPGLVFNLRHTFAVNSIMAGDDIKTLQENMGHYSAAFTLDRYGHVTETMRRESSNRMQAFIENM